MPSACRRCDPNSPWSRPRSDAGLERGVRPRSAAGRPPPPVPGSPEPGWTMSEPGCGGPPGQGSRGPVLSTDEAAELLAGGSPRLQDAQDPAGEEHQDAIAVPQEFVEIGRGEHDRRALTLAF